MAGRGIVSYALNTGSPFTELARVVGAQNVLTAKEDLIPYSFDGTAALRQMPGCVVLAKTCQKWPRFYSWRTKQKRPW